jgi:hypothetical protein
MKKTLVAGFMMVGILVAGCSQAVPAPELKPDIGPGKGFTYLRPQGWRGEGKIEVGGNAGSIELRKNAAYVRIGADLAGSLMADVSTASSNSMGAAGDALPGGLGTAMRAANKPAVEKLHDIQGTTLAAKFKDFKDGKMQPFQSKLGEGRFSEFTGELDANDIHGYRVTILGSDKRYSVRTQCTESDWKTLKPIFEKIVQSVGPGPEN